MPSGVTSEGKPAGGGTDGSGLPRGKAAPPEPPGAEGLFLLFPLSSFPFNRDSWSRWESAASL